MLHTRNHQLAVKSVTPLANVVMFLAFAVSILVSAPAYAQDRCETIGEDPEWAENIKQLIKTMQEGDMQAAKIQSKQTAEICPNAPALNYLQGKIAEALGETKDALYYYQKASENTYTFAVEPDTAKKIWYARYENEHPERTAGALSSTNTRLDALENENAQLRQEKHDTYGQLMWTGVGIGIGGLILTGIGSAVVASTKPVSLYVVNGVNYEYQSKPAYAFGWSSLGIGLGLLATGSILAGIFGYKYSQSDAGSEDIAFSISPVSFSIEMRF